MTGCQTVEMQRLLNENFGKPALLLPFYEEVKVVENTREKEFDFFIPVHRIIIKIMFVYWMQ